MTGSTTGDWLGPENTEFLIRGRHNLFPNQDPVIRTNQETSVIQDGAGKSIDWTGAMMYCEDSRGLGASRAVWTQYICI